MKRSRFRIRWNNPLGLRTKLTRERKKISWQSIVRYSLTGLAVFFVGFVVLLAYYAKDLPTPGKIKTHHAAEATQILDRNGQPLYAVYNEEKRITIPTEQIPVVVKDATISVEDKDFYKHHGVDIHGMIRGLILKPLMGERAQGGSTITQQYVKNALLSNERTFDRKFKEIIISLEIEVVYSKDQILGLYLNEIPYGSNAYGIEAAAQTFLGKPAKDLNLAEAATLAALPQRPSYLSPYGNHLDELKARKDYILGRMQTLGYITEEQAAAAKAQEVAFVPRHEQITAPHFVFYVRDQLIQKYGEQLVLEGGLKVTTTLDPKAQASAEKAIATAATKLDKYRADNAALAAVDPKTGQVLAMVGSVDYFNKDRHGNFNVTTALRQPGSSFKPIAYATAFKDHLSPSSMLWDVTTDFGKYSPQDYDGKNRGPVTVRTALANSLNIPAVKTLAIAGVDKTIQTAKDLGITSLTDPSRYGLALVLGGAEVRPLELAAAYGGFANGGEFNPTTSILKVEDSQGHILEEWKPQPKMALAPEIAYEITHILIDNEARTPIFGAHSPLYFSDRPVAAKTGTTQEYRDSWTAGYTPSVATAVWVGNNDHSPMDSAGGVKAAGPIFHDFMSDYLKGSPPEAFARPDTIKEVTVDAMSGKLPTKYSPQTITDIFAPWQIPTDQDDVHVSVKVNKLNGKLATDVTPPELIEERLYTNIHSERPNDPRWETPVIDWAKANGYDVGFPPKEKDDTSPDQLPRVALLSPANNAVVTGPFDIIANPSSKAGQIAQVEFSVDGVVIGTAHAEPWTLRYDGAQLSPGNHELAVDATDQNGIKAHASVVILAAHDDAPPGPVTQLSAQQVSIASIKLSWQNPSDTDLAKVRIYRSTASGQLGALVLETNVTPAASGTVTITGNAPGTQYYFTVRTLDAAGNESKNTDQVSSFGL